MERSLMKKSQEVGTRFIVAGVLNVGRQQPITARELAAFFETDQRTVTQEIERERAAGAPILASCSEGCSGYYLPSCEDDRREYLRRLDSRLESIQSNRDAIAKAKLFDFFDTDGAMSVPFE